MTTIRFHNGFNGIVATDFAAGVEAATRFFEWLGLRATPANMTATGYTAAFTLGGQNVEYTVTGSALTYGTGSGHNGSNLIPYSGQIDRIEVRLVGQLILSFADMPWDAQDFASAQLGWTPLPGALGQGWTDTLHDLLHGPAAQPGNWVQDSGPGLNIQLGSAQAITARPYDPGLDYHPYVLNGYHHLPGDDMIIGSAGHDTIESGWGADTLYGGGGNDRLYAGSAELIAAGQLTGNDVYGGAGHDRIVAGGTASTAYGGTGNDEVAANTAYGGSGNDTLRPGSAFYSLPSGGTTVGVDVVLYGEGGNDELFGYIGAGSGLLTVHLYGGLGDDTILGDKANSGPDAGDWLTALDDGDDIIDAGVGNDLVWGGFGADSIRGGAGDDVLYGDALYPNLDPSDLLYGLVPEPQGGNDTIRGGAGNDSIDGMGGDDILRGDDGADTITGAAGRDRLWGGADNDRLIGGLGNDRIWGGDGNDRLLGGAGRDTLFGGAGRDSLFGGAGHDSLTADSPEGLLDGGAGNDTLIGGGDDTLFGGAGDDLITGGHRSEIHAGTGADTLYGGEDSSRYVYSSLAEIGLGAGADWIMDFRTGGAHLLDLQFLTALNGGSPVTVTQGGFAGPANLVEIALINAPGLGDPTLLQIDIDRDMVADAELWFAKDTPDILINGLTAADILL